jgi:Glycosyl transferase family 2
MPAASILVPTHSHASTLPLAVASALAQSVPDVEVLIIGDGVTPEVRGVAERLVAADERVRFFDHPKGENHGETYRDDAVNAASSDAIFYLCDDDLLMHDHVSDLLALLDHFNFVQCKNGYISTAGAAVPYPGDLSDPVMIEAMLNNTVAFNFVSITGTAHSRDFYRLVGQPWTSTPPGEWPDHHQWRKMVGHPMFSGQTSVRMTALQFPTSEGGRERWTERQRLAEIEPWAAIALSSSGQRVVDQLVAHGERFTLGRNHLTILELGIRVDAATLWQARRGQIIADRVSRFVYGLPLVRRTRRSSR